MAGSWTQGHSQLVCCRNTCCQLWHPVNCDPNLPAITASVCTTVGGWVWLHYMEPLHFFHQSLYTANPHEFWSAKISCHKVCIIKYELHFLHVPNSLNIYVMWLYLITLRKVPASGMLFGWYCCNTILELFSWVAWFPGSEELEKTAIFGIITSLTPHFWGRSQNKANHHLIPLLPTDQIFLQTSMVDIHDLL